MSVIQMTSEQLSALISEIRASASSGSTAPVASAPEVRSKNSLCNCPAQFGGERDHNIVEEFITTIVTYKEVENITDEDALKGISLRFYGLASTWWQGIKKEAKTWNDAIALIRTHFSPSKPAYQLYLEITGPKQAADVPIDTFICEKRALLAQLPEGRHDQETEIDLIYGLLHVKIRDHIPRHEIHTFKELLEKGRLIESTRSESYQKIPQVPERSGDPVERGGHYYRSRPYSYGRGYVRGQKRKAPYVEDWTQHGDNY